MRSIPLYYGMHKRNNNNNSNINNSNNESVNNKIKNDDK